MAGVYSLCCESSDLTAINLELDSIAETENWSPNLLFNVRLVVEELVLNIFSYGGSGKIRAWLDITPIKDGIDLRISDNAKPFDPLGDSSIPDTDAAIEDRPIGGLGVHLVKTLASELSYRRENNLNVLKLTLK